MKKLVNIFDLDCTLIDSTHRANEFGDVSLGFDIEYWSKNATHERMKDDKLLPLVEVFYEFQKTKCTNIAITARKMKKPDYDFLKKHNLNFHMIIHRDNSIDLDHVMKKKKLTEFLMKNDLIPFLAFDDIPENLAVYEKFGFKCFNAMDFNKQLNGKDVPCTQLIFKK